MFLESGVSGCEMGGNVSGRGRDHVLGAGLRPHLPYIGDVIVLL